MTISLKCLCFVGSGKFILWTCGRWILEDEEDDDDEEEEDGLGVAFLINV